jgi:hypothetical protein
MGTFESAGAVPISTPCQVVFGQTSSGQLWGFTGFITSGNITYGVFRHNMIPSRAQIDIQMTTTYVAPQTPASASPSDLTNQLGSLNLLPGSAPLTNQLGSLNLLP